MYPTTKPYTGASQHCVYASIEQTQRHLNQTHPLKVVFDFLLEVKRSSFNLIYLSSDGHLMCHPLWQHFQKVMQCLPEIRLYCNQHGGHAYFRYLLCLIDEYDIEAVIQEVKRNHLLHQTGVDVYTIDTFNAFISDLRTHLEGYQAGYATGSHRYNPDQLHSMQTLLDDGFKRYSKLLVLRVDLRYRDDIEVSYEQAKDDISSFMDSRRYNSLFVDSVGHAYKLERGVNFHFHTLWLINGHKHQKDAHIAQCIADRWTRMTDGRGIAYVCNYHKTDYLHCGIGMVLRHDEEKRKYLVQAASYLCKEDPLTKAYVPAHHRVFFRSVVR